MNTHFDVNIQLLASQTGNKRDKGFSIEKKNIGEEKNVVSREENIHYVPFENQWNVVFLLSIHIDCAAYCQLSLRLGNLIL